MGRFLVAAKSQSFFRLLLTLCSDIVDFWWLIGWGSKVSDLVSSCLRGLVWVSDSKLFLAGNGFLSSANEEHTWSIGLLLSLALELCLNCLLSAMIVLLWWLSYLCWFSGEWRSSRPRRVFLTLALGLPTLSVWQAHIWPRFCNAVCWSFESSFRSVSLLKVSEGVFCLVIILCGQVWAQQHHCFTIYWWFLAYL